MNYNLYYTVMTCSHCFVWLLLGYMGTDSAKLPAVTGIDFITEPAGGQECSINVSWLYFLLWRFASR